MSEESITFLLKAGTHLIRVRDGGEGSVREARRNHPHQRAGCHQHGGLGVGRHELGDCVWWADKHQQPCPARDTQVVKVETTKDVIFTIAVKQLD